MLSVLWWKIQFLAILFLKVWLNNLIWYSESFFMANFTVFTWFFWNFSSGLKNNWEMRKLTLGVTSTHDFWSIVLLNKTFEQS